MSKLSPQKKSLLGILAIGLLVGLGIFFLRSDDNNHVEVETREGSKPVVMPSSTPETTQEPKQSFTQDTSGAQPAGDVKQNIHTMTRVLFDHLSPNRKATDLLLYLKQSGQEPYTSTSSNPHTGGMMFVRTKKPFKGTRYFHAQYVEGENGSIVPQHMSFEFVPGPEAMAMAEEALRAIKPQLGEPHDRTENFISWKLEDGYHCYIAKLDAEYIKEHPFNTYEPEDVGTIKIAVEMDIHP